MTYRCVRIVLLLTVMIVAAGRESLACSCAAATPCQAAGYADAVFSGTVASIDMVSGNDGSLQRLIVVRMNVEQGFMNAPQPAATITMDMSSCTYSFKVGEQYLVYAFNQSGHLTTSSCSRTRPLKEAAEDLKYLAMLRSGEHASRISGRITETRRNPAEREFVDYGPIEGIPVSVRGSAFVRSVVTDADGRYEVANLPAGKVTVAILSPFGYEPESFQQDIDLADGKACRQFDVLVHPVARASGLVVDASDRPLAGVPIDAVAAELAGFDPPRYQRPATTDQRGVFEFKDLPPGSYAFGVNLTKEPYDKPRRGASIFLPGTSAASEATVVELKAGDRKDLGTLRLTVR